MANNRKATRSRLIQRTPMFDFPKDKKKRKLIGYRFIKHVKYDTSTIPLPL